MFEAVFSSHCFYFEGEGCYSTPRYIGPSKVFSEKMLTPLYLTSLRHYWNLWSKIIAFIMEINEQPILLQNHF